MERANTARRFTKKCYFYKYHALLVKWVNEKQMKFGLKRYIFLFFSYMVIYSVLNIKQTVFNKLIIIINWTLSKLDLLNEVIFNKN